MATIVDGDFEWDEDNAASNFAKHHVSFPEAATVFADLRPCTWTMVREQIAWSSSAPRYAIACFMSSTWNAGAAIASTVHGQQVVLSGTFTNLEANHDPVS